ncbi:MAG: P-type conjugative transfer protein VirB9 [Legionellales bacterium]|nr:P-type conjugative transfer protein VirB9 [Legionellales bacterium]
MISYFNTKLISAILFCFTLTTAWALVTPAVSQFDHRIQVVNYNPNDVVKLNGVLGIATEIILEPDEVYLAHAFGDPQAWEFTHIEHYIFLKPKAQNGDTNLIVVTNKRSYHFELHYLADPVSLTTYQLSFRYPDEIAEHKKTVNARQVLNRAFSQKAGPINLNYLMTNDRQSRSIAPSHVWDDGRFTYFQFPGDRDLPTIYKVEPDGSETIVNRHNQGTDNNMIVLEKVASRWVLRLGSRVVGVVNRRFNPEGIANHSGTISPAVIRVVKRSAP